MEPVNVYFDCGDVFELFDVNIGDDVGADLVNGVGFRSDVEGTTKFVLRKFGSDGASRWPPTTELIGTLEEIVVYDEYTVESMEGIDGPEEAVIEEGKENSDVIGLIGELGDEFLDFEVVWFIH
jgi:hypothetical protein